MKRSALRLTLLTFSAVTLLIGAAGVLGRTLSPPVVVVQDRQNTAGKLQYTLIDIDRHARIGRIMDVPDVLDQSWYTQPPIVMQRKIREARGEFVDWVFSTADVRRNTFTPIMYLTTRSEARVRVNDALIRRMPDGSMQVAVYVPFTGEVWTSTSDSPEAVLLTTAERLLDFPLGWSPDGKWLVLKGYGQNGLTVIDASDGSQQKFEAPEMAWVQWSSDSRYLLINSSSMPDLDVPAIPLLIDLRDGTQTPLENMTSLTWCGGDLIAIDADNRPPQSILRIDLETMESREVFNLDTLEDFETTGMFSVSSSCDWFILNGLVDNEQRLLNIDTGEMIPLGRNILPIEVTEETLTYQVEGDDAIEVRRVRLDSDEPPVTLAAFPLRYGYVRWLDDLQRGLVLQGNKLMLIDVRDSSSVVLAQVEASAYSVLESR